MIPLHTIWEPHQPLTEKRILQFSDDRVSQHFPVRVARGVVNRSSFSVWILSVVSLGISAKDASLISFHVCSLGSYRLGREEVFGITVHEGECIPLLLCHRSSQVGRAGTDDMVTVQRVFSCFIVVKGSTVTFV